MLTLKKTLSLAALTYLRFWAKLQLKKNPQAIVIGITGSAGKTSTRLALRQILAQVGKVKHSAHANSESGIPLNILGLTLSDYSLLSWLRVLLLAPLRYLTFHETYTHYVVEMGIDSPESPKNMDYLLSIVRPDMAIILGVSLSHAAAFDHLVKDTHPARRRSKLLALIAKEKMKLATSLPPTGTAVLNQDDLSLAPHIAKLGCRRLTFGSSPRADFRLLKTAVSRHGFNVKFRYLAHDYQLTLPDPYGLEYAQTFLSAIALAHALGVSLPKAIAALHSYRAPAGRLRLFPGIKGTHLLDSSYNASPGSMHHALTLLHRLAPRAPRLAVLGDMRELGLQTKAAHQALAKLIPRYTTEVILFGPAMAQYCLPPLLRAHFPVYHASTMADLKRYLATRLKPGMWVLFKASQNQLLLERAVASVLAHPSDAVHLPRRGPYWDRLRNTTP